MPTAQEHLQAASARMAEIGGQLDTVNRQIASATEERAQYERAEREKLQAALESRDQALSAMKLSQREINQAFANARSAFDSVVKAIETGTLEGILPLPPVPAIAYAQGDGGKALTEAIARAQAAEAALAQSQASTAAAIAELNELKANPKADPAAVAAAVAKVREELAADIAAANARVEAATQAAAEAQNAAAVERTAAAEARANLAAEIAKTAAAEAELIRLQGELATATQAMRETLAPQVAAAEQAVAQERAADAEAQAVVDATA